MITLKGMKVLRPDGKIVDRYVHLEDDRAYVGIVKIDKGYQKVIKSANPLLYQWVVEPAVTEQQATELVALVIKLGLQWQMQGQERIVANWYSQTYTEMLEGLIGKGTH